MYTTVTAITQSTASGEENSTQISYTNGCITELRSGNNVVNYEYDGKGRKTSVDLNGQKEYVKYTYNDTAGTTVTNTIGGMQCKQDMYGNVVETSYNGAKQTASTYDAQNRLTKLKDCITDTTTQITYDAFDRISSVTDGKVSEYYSYDIDGDLQIKSVGASNKGIVYTYGYKNTLNRKLKSIWSNGIYVQMQDDCLGRNTDKLITVNGLDVAEESIAYRKVGDHATNMPSTIRFGNRVASSVIATSTPSVIATSVSPVIASEAKQSITQFIRLDNIKYKYDNCGNISEIQENGSLAARYTYDKLNRLIREDNKQLHKTTLFTYDNNGNILSKREFAFTLKATELLEELESTDTLYAYDGDRLLSFGDEQFTYDNIGNPTTYRGKSVTCEYGRNLVSYNGVTFNYDGRGRRISKTQGDNTIEFTYDSNGNLFAQNNGLLFMYDNSGLFGLKYNDEFYAYRKDAQGNIIALLDSNGVVVVKYVYDAWGNHEVKVLDSACTELSQLNPFRYRGYYYDTETGLYFLKTRYYDPEVGRFITIDDISYLDPEHINGLNLYAYCANNPVMNVDPEGTSWWSDFWKGFGSFCAIVGGIALCFVPGAQAIGAGLIIAGAGGLIGGAIGVATGNGFGYGWNVGTLIGGTIGLIVAAPQLADLVIKATIPTLGGMIVGNGVMAAAGAIAISIPIGKILIGLAAVGLGILFEIQRMGPGRHSNNRAENKYIDYLQNKYNFDDDFRRRLHDKITKRGLAKKMIEEIIRKMLGL